MAPTSRDFRDDRRRFDETSELNETKKVRHRWTDDVGKRRKEVGIVTGNNGFEDVSSGDSEVYSERHVEDPRKVATAPERASPALPAKILPNPKTTGIRQSERVRQLPGLEPRSNATEGGMALEASSLQNSFHDLASSGMDFILVSEDDKSVPSVTAGLDGGYFRHPGNLLEKSGKDKDERSSFTNGAQSHDYYEEGQAVEPVVCSEQSNPEGGPSKEEEPNTNGKERGTSETSPSIVSKFYGVKNFRNLKAGGGHMHSLPIDVPQPAKQECVVLGNKRYTRAGIKGGATLRQIRMHQARTSRNFRRLLSSGKAGDTRPGKAGRDLADEPKLKPRSTCSADEKDYNYKTSCTSAKGCTGNDRCNERSSINKHNSDALVDELLADLETKETGDVSFGNNSVISPNVSDSDSASVNADDADSFASGSYSRSAATFSSGSCSSRYSGADQSTTSRSHATSVTDPSLSLISEHRSQANEWREVKDAWLEPIITRATNAFTMSSRFAAVEQTRCIGSNNDGRDWRSFETWSTTSRPCCGDKSGTSIILPFDDEKEKGGVMIPLDSEKEANNSESALNEAMPRDIAPILPSPPKARQKTRKPFPYTIRLKFPFTRNRTGRGNIKNRQVVKVFPVPPGGRNSNLVDKGYVQHAATKGLDKEAHALKRSIGDEVIVDKIDAIIFDDGGQVNTDMNSCEMPTIEVQRLEPHASSKKPKKLARLLSCVCARRKHGKIAPNSIANVSSISKYKSLKPDPFCRSQELLSSDDRPNSTAAATSADAEHKKDESTDQSGAIKEVEEETETLHSFPLWTLCC